ncbi:uncharacterized protein LOC110459757 isoform X3 [Mizuhopecten yessoensis]|uniref:uncharacterized protein LOC110459757 isoform X3 n=1 Tax=Mizuhopecten yessoensis TaxID=6573 RepID=UPI000B45A9E3|nr:uncharacterized protein LOC110459757 isoform X3 [Mizuhopecten yessoensis]
MGKMESRQSSETIEANAFRKTTYQDNQRFYSKGGCCVRALIGLLIVFVVTTCVLSVVLIWRENRSSFEPITSESLQKAYPGYFRTLKEQVEFEVPVDPIPAGENFTTVGFTCDVNCAVTPVRRRRDAADKTFHGCCESQSSGCTGCTCMLDRAIETAVVYKIGKTSSSASFIADIEIDTFYFNKCCKCVNVRVNG